MTTRCHPRSHRVGIDPFTPSPTLAEPQSVGFPRRAAGEVVRARAVQSEREIRARPPPHHGRLRLLYVVCRPSGTWDVELRAIVNRLLQDLGEDLGRSDITALRPPTDERREQVLSDANAAGQPYHIVHFDGRGIYADPE